MELTIDHIIAAILSARTLSNSEKEAMLEKFKDPAITNEAITEMLQKLADSEIALRQEENTNLERIAVENEQERAEEAARIQPEVDAVYAEANTESTQVMQAHLAQMDTLDGDLAKVCETIKRGEHEVDQMAAIRAQLGIGGQ